MARRAASALTAILAFAAAGPVALLAGGTTPAAATSAASQPPAVAVFTGLTPRWASPGTTITVAGSVKNTAPVNQRLVVQLLDSITPVSSVTELEQGASGALYGLAGLPLPQATWTSSLLKPGATASWSIRVPVSAMGFTKFGVYPLAAQIYNSQHTPLNNTLTYVPYIPAKGAPYGSSVPAAEKIAWVWPLIDEPLLEEPWQSVCTGAQAPQAAALAQSLTSGGRLGQLVDTAGATAGTAVVQAQAARTGAGTAAQRLATLTGPGQSLSQSDAVTWAVDPALLANVSALSQCGASEPQWARTASAWLARLKETTAGQPMLLTPYGDPNVTALIGAGHAGDVESSFTDGRNRASQILGRNLAPSPAGSNPAGAAAVAWSAGAPTGDTAAELAGKDGVGTVLADSSAFPRTQGSVVRALNGIGGYVTVLLANNALSSLLGSAAGSGSGSAFTIAQQFLAETAVLAEDSSTPIIVAPPQRWQPSAALASALLSVTASVPWLSPATLSSLTAAAHVPTVQLPTAAPGLSPLEQQQLSALDADVARQVALRADPNPTLSQAVSTVESSAYSGQFQATGLGMIQTLARRMADQEHGVHIVAENRITLGGTHGSVPVSIDNTLPFPVRVALQLSYSQADGMQVSASPPGLRTIPAHTAETVRLRITAAQTGSTTITMTLLNQASQPLASPQVRTTVQTTQVGLLGMIIFGAALGVFLLASAVRAIRRRKPRQVPDEALRAPPREGDQPGHSSEEAGPDTVVTGSTGTAPPSTAGRGGMHQAR